MQRVHKSLTTPPETCTHDVYPPMMEPAPRLTYVIGNGQNIKIGRTTDLETRIKGLQHDRPLTVLATYEGDIEKHLHAACAPWRVRGEWFAIEAVDVALRTIDAIRNGTFHLPRIEAMTRNAKTARLSQRIDPALKAKIAAEAERRHLDETAIVTIALNEYFERQAANPAEPTIIP